ncbi:MAG: hypothetical protein AB1512_03310 [Thermodesulfobacteriota bacterium]
MPGRSCLFLLLLAIILPGVLFAEVKGRLEKEGLLVLFEDPLHGLAERSARVYPDILREVESKLGLSLPIPPTLVLVREHETFRNMGAHRPMIAFAVPARGLIVVDCSRADREPFTMEETLKHELTHLLTHHFVGGREIPKWLDEGLAQWVSGGLGEVVRNLKTSLLEEAVLSGRLMGMRSLSGSFPRSENALLLAYEESEDLVGHIIRQHGMAGVIRILQHLKTGEEWEDAVQKGLGVPFDDLERSWQDRLQRRKSWFMFLSRHLYEILFFVAAVASAYGFLRAYLKKRAYLREDEGEEP